MNIYRESDYRKILIQSVEEKRKLDPSFSNQGLAEAMRIQKSYLSKVFNGKADFSTDQLYLASQYLKFNEEQKQYLFLLLELARSGLSARRTEIERKIREIQTRFLHTREHLKSAPLYASAEGLASYYLDPLTQIVHISLAIDRYAKNPVLLAQDLQISQKRIRNLVERLESLEVIGKKGGRYVLLVDHIHLPRESPVYETWRDQLKLASIQRLRNQTADRSYSFSAVFAADEETRRKIQGRFLELIKTVEEEAKDAPYRDTLQLTFDLFSWT